MWTTEVRHCGSVPALLPAAQSGERLRDASLQVVLLMLLFGWPAGTVLDRLALLHAGSPAPFPDRERLADWLSRLPVRCRGGRYEFLASEVHAFDHLPVRCALGADLRWLLQALAAGRSPLPRSELEGGLADLAAAFAARPQVGEVLLDVRAALEGAPADCARRTPPDWVEAYEAVSADRQYNAAAELLIEAIGLGTYPLVRACNGRWPNEPITRNDVRGLYANRRSVRLAERRRRLVGRLAEMLPDGVSWAAVHTGYLHRKVGRIVGPQSDVNPMEVFVRRVLRGCTLPPGFAVGEAVLDTFASGLTHSTQAGKWRASLALRSAGEVIPVVASAMRDGQDCGHKVRELTGHLRLARHALGPAGLEPTTVRRGLAVLEGGYTEADRIAFHLAGYHVCSLDTLPAVVASLGVRGS
jgi:hypothetical protein